MILYILNIVDLISTLVALSCGLVEINPIMNLIIRIHPALFLFVKIVPAYFLCWWLRENAKKNKSARNRYIIINCIFAMVVVWNIICTIIWVMA